MRLEEQVVQTFQSIEQENGNLRFFNFLTNIFKGKYSKIFLKNRKCQKNFYYETIQYKMFFL